MVHTMCTAGEKKKIEPHVPGLYEWNIPDGIFIDD